MVVKSKRLAIISIANDEARLKGLCGLILLTFEAKSSSYYLHLLLFLPLS